MIQPARLHLLRSAKIFASLLPDLTPLSVRLFKVFSLRLVAAVFRTAVTSPVLLINLQILRTVDEFVGMSWFKLTVILFPSLWKWTNCSLGNLLCK